MTKHQHVFKLYRMTLYITVCYQHKHKEWIARMYKYQPYIYNSYGLEEDLIEHLI